ncbi:MAG: lamin tail domain-containing protein [Myxococcaceae bacterium]|nr:lamin tail domain-containing protein [Myxococcaceae bacterium]
MKAISTWICAAALVLAAGCKPQPPPEEKVPVPATVISFTSSATEVEAGGKVTLSWEVKDATSVQISPLGGAALELADPSASNGSVEVAVNQDTVFVLTARGEGGNDQGAVSVLIRRDAPTVAFSAIPEKIEAGGSATLVWNAPGADSATITDGAGQVIHSGAPQGSIAVSPLGDTEYTLTAGDLSAHAKVAVKVAILGFTASVQAAQPGDPVTLSWHVGAADSVTLSATGRGVLTTITDPAQIADGSFTDTLPGVDGASGQVTYTLTATQGGQTVTAARTVYTGADPVVTAFNAPAYARTGNTWTVSWKTVLADRVDVIVDGVTVHRATTRAEVEDGSFTVDTGAAPQALVLEVSNARGGKVTKTALVEPVGAPSLVSFNGNPATVVNGGEPLTLSWEVPNARHVRISVQGGPVVAERTGHDVEQASLDVFPNTHTVYVFEADNTLGEAITPQTFTVDVTNPAHLIYSAEPVPEGARIQITGATVNGQLEPLDFTPTTAPGEEFVDISQTGNPVSIGSSDDTAAYLVDLGKVFTTTVKGITFSGRRISIATNGWFFFSDTTNSGVSVPDTFLPSSDYPPKAIVPFGRDLQNQSTTRIYWQLDGSGPSERLIVQWTDTRRYNNSDHLTFQARVYADGRIIFAYDRMSNLPQSVEAAVGLMDAAGGAVIPPFSQFSPALHPVAGDALVFADQLATPIWIRASQAAQTVRVHLPNDAFIDIHDSPELLPPGNFHIDEVNFHPSATAPLGEWFEVANNTSSPIDLNGWTIDFGAQGKVLIDTPLVLPPNGVKVFGRSNDPAQNGGITVDFVYPSAITLDDTAGSISLTLQGGKYTTAEWTSSVGGTGKTVRFEKPDPTVLIAGGGSTITCDGTGSYGDQIGTPGTKDAPCLHYHLSGPTVPNGFESIAATGTVIGSLSGSSTDSVYQQVTLTRPIQVFGATTNTLWVSSNGFITTTAITNSYNTNDTVPSTSAPNGVIAPFWDDLVGNATNSAVYLKQADPDGVPGSGDEYTLVSWENWKIWAPATASVNFQVKFIESTGDIEFHYGSMMSASDATYAKGKSATTWLETPDGRYAIAINVESTNPGIQPNTGYHFTYTP